MLHVTCYCHHNTYILLIMQALVLYRLQSSSSSFVILLPVSNTSYIAKSWSTKQFERKKQFGNQFYL